MSLVQRFATGTYKVVRSAAGTYVKGRYVPGEKECIQVSGSMQPSSAKELKLPEEGGRIHQVYKFFTDVPITTVNTKNLAEADIVEIDGETYRCLSLTTWKGTRLDYFVSAIWREPSQ